MLKLTAHNGREPARRWAEHFGHFSVYLPSQFPAADSEICARAYDEPTEEMNGDDRSRTPSW